MAPCGPDLMGLFTSGSLHCRVGGPFGDTRRTPRDGPRLGHQEEDGCMGCLGVEYSRGSSGGSSSSISGPIASGSATYSNWPLPSIDGPSAQCFCWDSAPSEKFMNL